MAVASTDVPNRYDVVITSGATTTGFVLADELEPNIPFRTQRATYSYTPTFVERQNVGNAYGDNAQAFFLTLSQNNWDLGEGRRFFRADDEDGVRRYWSGTNIDPVSTPGQVSMRNTVGTLTFSEALRAAGEASGGVYAAGATTLYLVDSAGTITSKGAHGLGATPSQWGLVSDSSNVYVATTSASTVGVRKYNGSSWSTFSATGSDSLAYFNNTLFGYANDTGVLQKYDTSGNATTLFTWKDAAGTALTGSGYQTRLRPYGGQLAILRTRGWRRQGELWVYDGTATKVVADFPANFVAQDLEEVNGILFIAGYVNRNSDKQPAIFYYANGTPGKLWQSQTAGYTNSTWPAMAGWGDGIAFTDDSVGSLMQYSMSTGGVHTIGTYTVTNATPMMAANQDVLVHTRNSTTGYYYPTTTLSTTATLITSLFDFENSLTKVFRGVKVEFDIQSGKTTSFDISYQVASVDGSWTSLQTGATSGTEYSLTSVTGRSIAFKITFNKGNATTTPALKRLYVRAAPTLQSFKKAEYILDLTGKAGVGGGSGVSMLRDGTPHPLTSVQQANNLITAIESGATISVTDAVNGTFTALAEPDKCELYVVRPGLMQKASGTVVGGEYVARLVVRQV